MKIRFNLQPWRENARKAQQKRFGLVTGIVVLGVGLFCGFNYFIENQYIEEQQRAKGTLNSAINDLRSVKREVEETQALIEEINKQITAIEGLQAQRGVALRLLDHIANKTPETVFLNDIIFDGEKLTIEGVAENDTGVAEFLRILQESELLQTPRVDIIHSTQSTDRYIIPDDTEIKSFTVLVDLAI